MTWAEERDEAAMEYSSYDPKHNGLNLISRDQYVGHLRGANWALRSSVVREMAEALKRIMPHYAPKDLGYVQSHSIFNDATEALAAYEQALKEWK